MKSPATFFAQAQHWVPPVPRTWGPGIKSLHIKTLVCPSKRRLLSLGWETWDTTQLCSKIELKADG